MIRFRGFVALSLIAATAFAAGPEKTECIVGARPGGGFDLTCRLAAAALLNAGLIDKPMRITYLDGGVGAVAMNHVVGKRPGDSGVLTAASSGSALLLAQKKFGRYDESAVRWLGAIGADYGVLFVAQTSPIRTLAGLVAEFEKDVAAFPVGGGGAVGSQDWMKVAAVARAAGLDPRKLRYVALEGGGSVLANLQSGFVKVGAGDASEVAPHVKAGKVRVLAVLSEQRLAGDLKDAPTAREQGFDIVWPIWRGFYLGPNVPQADYERWVRLFRKLAATPEFAREREARGLYPFDLVGAEFDARVKADIARFRELAKEGGLGN